MLLDFIVGYHKSSFAKINHLRIGNEVIRRLKSQTISKVEQFERSNNLKGPTI